MAGAGGVHGMPRFALLPPLPCCRPPAAREAAALDLASLLGLAGATLDGADRRALAATEAVTLRLRAASCRAAACAQRRLGPRRRCRRTGMWPACCLAGTGRWRAEPFLFDTGNAGALELFAASFRIAAQATAALPASHGARELGGSVRQAARAYRTRERSPGWTMRETAGRLRGAPGERRVFSIASGSLGCAASRRW